jgi:hypothetical protein
MTEYIKLINWDADRVMYNGLSTSICAEQSPLPVTLYLKDFIENKKWFTYDDVVSWGQEKGKDSITPIRSVGDLAECLTDFLYSMKKPGKDESVITKAQTKEGKQALLKGLSIVQIEDISEGIEYTPGLVEAVKAFKDDEIIQLLFSDGLGPHITYQIGKLGLDAGSGVPPIVEYNGKEFQYDISSHPESKLTGKIADFDKIEKFHDYLNSYLKMPLENVAVIDDSGSNVEKLHVPVRDAGGLALGFNVTDAHRPKFQENSIPIIKGENLEPFIEIVRDPREVMIARYCE